LNLVLRGHFPGSRVDDERSGCKNLVMGLFVSLGSAAFFASEIIFLVMYPLPIVGCYNITMLHVMLPL
jgi:hypothetical protein